MALKQRAMGPANDGSVPGHPAVAAIVIVHAQERGIIETAHVHTLGTASMSATAARGNVALLSVAPSENGITNGPTAGSENTTGHVRGTERGKETERGKAAHLTYMFCEKQDLEEQG